MDEELLEQKPDYRPYRRVFSRVGWALVALMLAPALVELPLLVVMTLLQAPLAQDELFQLVLGTVSTYLVGYPLAWFLLRRLPTVDAPTAPLSAGAWLRTLLMSLAAMNTVNFVTTILTTVIGELRGAPVTDPVEEIVAYPLPFLFLIVCILGPLAEEITFRGLVLTRLRPYGDTFAVFASALLFALLHGNLSQMFYAFALGVILGWVALRTGRIRETVALHAAANLFGGFIPSLVEQGLSGEVQEAAMYALMAFIFLSVLVGCVFLFLSFRRFQQPEWNGRWSQQRTWGLFFSNPGMVVFILLVLASVAAYLVI